MMSYLGHSPSLSLSLSIYIYIFLILCSYILIACFLMCSKLHLWLNFLVLVKLSGGKSPHCLYNRQMLKLLRIFCKLLTNCIMTVIVIGATLLTYEI